MKIKKHIPNTITCMNLASGMAGIYFVLQGNLFAATYFILIAAVFDFLDGMVARLLKVHSEIGKQLDSLADLVTFGVLPSFVLFQLLKVPFPDGYLPFFAFIIGIQSAMRLAKFNIDTRQSDRFIGVPTPANALLICTLPFLAEHFAWAGSMIQNRYFLLSLTVVLAFLLTAELPLIALKFKNLSFGDNVFRYLVIAIGAISVLWLGLAGVPFIILSYILLSLVESRLHPA
ncbi:CDP-diacylglycerol--serine O-phosphatidyltransferase [Echinicola vietnamensis]|uniref:CDP-diacylglycerol--serine O-phosphatidyltransferase n=1 Tax=Echinicola vietnamensis (strain DSM 17526 / LMG 23754 / KMM 6221) TaxID=926556 RepID=L0G2K6_ECHVK|nr:CDP-diacylglycerol--serine O-phosphatidyltransferase [Echinicola vietnamensis]AGA79065.1 CDP-diacylglycerol--serine O-phosphatidyltransferase [Echinicola vietnamensis DSM 17526]